ncbi:IncF plasmid conjugative transfer protein TraG [Rubrivivax sp. A210]|uniref:conjugal transfer protein TraG N-terminal domain-containing protein n=1 Tax=Rubrivivax sp. A210 TaxID=2772301 RepID=UPI00191A917D|nr:conjugal transfer protein TraG N-terminal domain-containing protein [Rubrivivax sp. A210]CAD5366847.1 IncF plasmid conjugative transfer protein TraG [Rubrivivax sp. A210]
MNPTQTLTVYAYGNVDALHGIFNAVAMMMSSSDYMDIIRVALIIGFAVVATLAALPGNLAKSWSWFLSVTVLTSILLVPKADVSIVDKLGQQSTAVVANVPWTLALLASVKTSIGHTLTEKFETAFQTIPRASAALPAELSYLEHGVMFGSRLVRASRDAEPMSLYAKADLVQYLRNCMFPEQGRAADAVENSLDLAASAGAMANPALSSSYHDVDNGNVLVTARCDTVWAKVLTKVNAAGAEAVRRAAQQSLPDLYRINAATAVDKIEASLPAIYGKAALAAGASSASQIMVQNIMINATAEASALYGASLNDPSTLMLATMQTQATQQMNAGNLVQGRIAEEALPVVRNITEGILYACFPVLCILLVASEGKALAALFKSYVYVLIWVELWPPMFAVVNYLQTLEAAKVMAGAAYLSGGTTGLTLGTASAVYSASVSTLATSAWMVTFVPVIAAAVLFGFDKIMAITGATGGGLRAAQSEASQATKGNLQAGNVSMDQQQLAAYRSDPAMYRTESVGGVEFRNVVNGQTLGQYREASAPVSLSDTTALTRGMATEASASMQAAQRHGKAYERSIDAGYSAALTAARGNAASASKALGWDVSKVGSEGVSATEVDDLSKKIASTHGVKDVSAITKALSAGLSGLSIPIFGANGKSESGELLSKEVSAGVDSLRKIGAQRKHDLVSQFRSGEAFEEARRSNRDATQRVESSWREAQGHRESESAELSRGQQLSAKVEGAERFAREASTKWNNSIDQFARARYGVSVHDGIADPRQWQKIVTAFIDAGSVRTDTPDGKPMFIPPDPGLGMNVVHTSLGAKAAAAARGGEPELEGRFAAAEPGGGAINVVAARAASDERLKQEQQRLGVNPTAEVRAPETKQRVAQGHGQAGAAAAAASATVKREQGEAQLSYDQRAEKVSTAHKPILNDRNRALDSVRGTDGTPRAFSDEASAEQKRKDAEATKFLEDAKKTVIPGHPDPNKGH